MGKKWISWLLTLGLLAAWLPARAQAVNLELAAPSCVLMDAATGTVLYEVDSHKQLAPASVTKVMTLLLVMEAIDSGRLGWDDMITASETAAAKGGSQIYLKVGEQMTVSDMVKSVAVSSANDCACALAEHLAGSEAGFVEKMNQRAQELGMNDTHFVNCTGLDDGENAAEHLTTAYDIALMSRELLTKHPDIKKYTTIWMDTVRDGAFGLANTNKLIRFYDGATGLKTGFTSSAGYCLSASAQRDGLELIAVVLNCASSTDRFQSAKALMDYGFASYTLADAGADVTLQPVEVKLGKAASVQPLLQEDAKLLLEKGTALETRVTLPESVTAPIEAGQVLGTLTATAGGKVMGEYPLVAGEAVERLTWADVTLMALRRICMG